MDTVKLYENNYIRSAWVEEKEEWYFSIIDVIAVLTKSDTPRKYGSVLKPL